MTFQIDSTLLVLHGVTTLLYVTETALSERNRLGGRGTTNPSFDIVTGAEDDTDL